MSIQAKHAAIEWRRMRDTETYYALRDGPRLYRSNWVIDTMAKYLPDDHVDLAKRLAATYARIHASGIGQAALERVEGGNSHAAQFSRTLALARKIRAFAGFEAAALGVGRDGFGCLRGICAGDTQAELARRVGYPEGSRRTLRRLVQVTLIALQDHEDDHPLDPSTEMEQQRSR